MIERQKAVLELLAFCIVGLMCYMAYQEMATFFEAVDWPKLMGGNDA